MQSSQIQTGKTEVQLYSDTYLAVSEFSLEQAKNKNLIKEIIFFAAPTEIVVVVAVVPDLQATILPHPTTITDLLIRLPLQPTYQGDNFRLGTLNGQSVYFLKMGNSRPLFRSFLDFQTNITI